MNPNDAGTRIISIFRERPGLAVGYCVVSLIAVGVGFRAGIGWGLGTAAVAVAGPTIDMVMENRAAAAAATATPPATEGTPTTSTVPPVTPTGPVVQSQARPLTMQDRRYLMAPEVNTLLQEEETRMRMMGPVPDAPRGEWYQRRYS